MQYRLKGLIPLVVSLAVFAMVAGGQSCSSEKGATESICDNGQDDDGDGKTDCADSDCAENAKCEAGQDGGTPDTGPTPDEGTADTKPAGDGAGGGAMQEDVIDSVTLPTSGEEFARDYDGTGPKNQLGKILGAFGVLGFDLQTEMDYQIKQGFVLILLEIFGASIVNDESTTVNAHLGDDLDDNASNNFSGSEPFGISSFSSPDTSLEGSITDGKLDVGPGSMVIPLPFGGVTPLLIKLRQAKLEATISAGGLSQAILTGALPETEMENEVIPAVATLLNDILGMATVPESVKDIIKNMIDGADETTKDGVITAAEIKASLVGPALKPDVDTDGDQTLDSLSMGVGLTAVTCKIQR